MASTVGKRLLSVGWAIGEASSQNQQARLINRHLDIVMLVKPLLLGFFKMAESGSVKLLVPVSWPGPGWFWFSTLGFLTFARRLRFPLAQLRFHTQLFFSFIAGLSPFFQYLLASANRSVAAAATSISSSIAIFFRQKPSEGSAISASASS